MSRAPWNNVLHPAVDAAERPLETAPAAVRLRRMHVACWTASLQTKLVALRSFRTPTGRFYVIRPPLMSDQQINPKGSHYFWKTNTSSFSKKPVKTKLLKY